MNWKEINEKRRLSLEKYRFYHGDYDFEDFNKSEIAKKLPRSTIGWGSRAVEMRANKTTFDCFENDELGLTSIMERYGIYDALNKLKEDILVAGCGFLGLVDGNKVLPFNAQEATGRFDWREQNLDYGAAIFNDKVTKIGNAGITVPKDYIIYEKNRTRVKRADDQEETIVPNPTGRPLMAVLTYRSTVARPFGNSTLNAAARNAIVDASRTNRQAMIAAYLYNVKVDVLLGVDSDTKVDIVPGQTGDTIAVSPNESGEIPRIGEFSQHAMAPFEDTILIAARNFCTATKLTLANLGIASDAPQSPEALEIVSDDLRDDINQWQHELGEQLKYFCLTLFMKENGLSKVDDNLREKYQATIPAFKPTYRVDMGKFGDGLYKIAEKAPGALLSRNLWRAMGLSSAEIDAAIASIQTGTNDILA